jgi:predicted metal-dependent HD superfamily phosphohydrolase
MLTVSGSWRRWRVLFPSAAEAAARSAHDALINAYTAPDRHYHNFAHVADCLSNLDAARDQADDPRAIEMAIWFHDAVYDPTRSDNELRSAELAAAELMKLGATSHSISRVRELILDTRHVAPPATRDGQLLVDIDLAGLAAEPHVFDANTELIRREYAHVSDADFRRGRAAFLRGLADRARIYQTTRFFDLYEARARANLARAVASLGGSGDAQSAGQNLPPR